MLLLWYMFYEDSMFVCEHSGKGKTASYHLNHTANRKFRWKAYNRTKKGNIFL